MTSEHDDIDQARLESLSTRERQVMIALALGAERQEIAEKLGTSDKTVDTHRGHVLGKLCVRNTVQLARLALRLEVVTLGEKLDDCWTRPEFRVPATPGRRSSS